MKITNRWTPPPEPHRHHIGQSVHATKSPISLPKPSQSPDMPHVMVSRINGRIFPKKYGADCMGHIYQDPEEEEEEEESTTEENIFTSTNPCFGYSCSSAETSDASSVSSSLSRHGHWCEEEKAYPLKKRRVISEETVTIKKEKKTNINSNKNVVIKGGGLRCSRTNGRGWRCSQQRLVGHTVCKYHVTMDKIRNQAQSRSQSESIIKLKKVKNIYDDDDDDEDGERFVVRKKRKRVGVVKARSMSSLLRQTVPLLPVTL